MRGRCGCQRWHLGIARIFEAAIYRKNDNRGYTSYGKHAETFPLERAVIAPKQSWRFLRCLHRCRLWECRAEEPELESSHGQVYRVYLQHTGMILPKYGFEAICAHI